MGIVRQDALEVEAGLVVGDALDEEGFVGCGAVEPDFGVAGAGVVTGEGGYGVFIDIIPHPVQVICAEGNVDEGAVEQNPVNCLNETSTLSLLPRIGTRVFLQECEKLLAMMIGNLMG